MSEITCEIGVIEIGARKSSTYHAGLGSKQDVVNPVTP